MGKKEKDPNKKSFFTEFKEFVTRGNVLDMAVGVIIGGAFTAIVTALTSGILQPLINWILGLILPGNGLEAARTVLGEPVYTLDDNLNKVIDWSKTNYIDWGTFISAIINFLLVALILFLIIKGINTLHKAGNDAKEAIAKKVVKKDEGEDAVVEGEAKK